MNFRIARKSNKGVLGIGLELTPAIILVSIIMILFLVASYIIMVTRGPEEIVKTRAENAGFNQILSEMSVFSKEEIRMSVSEAILAYESGKLSFSDLLGGISKLVGKERECIILAWDESKDFDYSAAKNYGANSYWGNTIIYRYNLEKNRAEILDKTRMSNYNAKVSIVKLNDERVISFLSYSGECKNEL